LTEYTRVTSGKLSRKVEDLDSLRFMMNILKEVRLKESCIEQEMSSIIDMYQMLEHHLPSGFMAKEDIDKKTVMRAIWKKLVNQAHARTDELSKMQYRFKHSLINDVATFREDVLQVSINNSGPHFPI
jgi:dynein heavy chain